MRMSGKNINLNDKNIENSDFHKNKKLNNINDIDVNKILVSKKESYGIKNSFKYFIGYNDNDIIRPLYIRLPQMTGYAKKFDKNQTMPFRVNNKQLLKNYNRIWEKVESLLNIDFENKLVYGDDDKYIKTKIYENSLITNFHNKKIPKEKDPYKCLSIIIIDSVSKSNKKYYPQTFSEKCKYVQEKIKTENYIEEDLDSDYNDGTESDIGNNEWSVKSILITIKA